MYSLIRKIFFQLEPEQAHYTAMNLLQTLRKLPGGKNTIHRIFRAPQKGLQKHVFGLSFRNPVGLGAGFDKNARYLEELDALGFGFVEIGTVTPLPQEGNEKPRLFRLVEDRALINRMGFNNEGVEVIARRLRNWRLNGKPLNPAAKLLVGGNIGKNKVTPNEEAWKDYEICFRALHAYVDFFVVNVSSPNTPGLRALQEKDALHKILTHLQALNKGFAVQRPILLKIAPDLEWSQIDDVIALAREIKLDGLVATNTTISRSGLQTPAAALEQIGAGGLSGAPLKERATEVVQYLCSQLKGEIPVIASGGIFTAADAREKLATGAALCEVWTGFIYEGPAIVQQICKGLAR
ncbi:dihydroorotate oxidase A [Cnuella takakiae]|uniref:Dihydroorotate dehydrogenase (quinone) n=1 Tax=Cnuella takakiae TaxID=1302690 RepID=A0A1M4WN40_9BACT|nr:quinone-dependent dihydroorotate dehydrogenase [Cnuella takakiae]OLY91670.1 dihydroorotate dehydrogenase (quinone) [Cnuella takakiae]SHE82669.1 dihydroorotate oxidase A [Cnuella takakiae]